MFSGLLAQPNENRLKIQQEHVAGPAVRVAGGGLTAGLLPFVYYLLKASPLRVLCIFCFMKPLEPPCERGVPVLKIGQRKPSEVK